MIKQLLALTLLATSSTVALAMPDAIHSSRADGLLDVERVRIICDESGVCVRPPKPKPTARWFYGDRVFYGPYDGPRFYGDPARHYGWSFLGIWLW